MSEEIDLNTNNLCTTEDAFEKFQAISMYEEDEFITLSDLVSPRQEVSDQGDLNDIRYENEVILDSQLEEQVPEVNSTIELGPDENKVVEECSSLPKEYTTECSSSIERAQETRPKKGRRKKTQQNDSILTVNHTHNEQQEILTLDDKQYQSTPPPSTPQRRRGRKPKQNKQVIDNVSITGTTLNDTEKVDNSMQIIPANIDDIESQNTSTENENFSGSPYPKRRGRPKKKHQVKNIDLPKEENNTLKTEEGVSEIIEAKDFMTSDESNLTQKVTKKGKRKQQLSVEKDFHEEIDTMDTEPTFSGQSLELEKCSNTVPIKPIKGPKKPRKSKKHQNKNTLIKDPTETDFKKTLSEEDFGDDISLSKLKETLEPPNGVSLETQNTEEMLNDSTNVPCSVTEKTELMEIEIKEIKTINSDLPTVVEPDLNTTIDIKENKQEISVNDIENKEDINDSLLIEDISKRPMRRRARKTFHYDEDSDEDPFANVELSEDDEPKRGKKSGKYYSDDEYIPGGKKHGSISSSDASDSDIDAVVNEFNSKLKRKRQRLDVSTDKSPKKYGKKTKCEKDKSLEVKTITPDTSLILEDDIEVCLQSSLIKANEDSKQKLGWGASNEFENFIAKRIQGTDIKIKKASSVQPLEIPVIDPNDAKKTKETSTQTARVHTTSAEVQTSVPYDIPMKDNVPLTIEQTEKACEFLKGIVKTTAELGQLMTQKSEDFISKKINTSHVTDTFKMDYCVRKSFLLFKLAKHNLMQMEEDLSKRYDEFLKDNDLVKHREKPKELLSTKKSDDGDSDCEIIDAPPIVLQKPKKENTKPKFNPKTVFLNKELSIKIAKKPSEEKKLEIKGRHTVWISDSVMVKKVKPTQSFLAKGSRKKKPPDYITIEMVNNFFKEYNRKQALLACAPFVTTEWLYSFNENVVCSYFVTKCDEYSSGSVSEIPSDSELDSNNETIIINPKNMSIQHSNNELKTYNVSTLFSLCTQVLQRQLNLTTSKPYDKSVNKQGLNNRQVLHSLNYMCLKNIKLHITPNLSLEDLEKRENRNALPLLTLCFNKITEAMDNHYHELHKDSNPKSQCYNLDLQLSKDELHPVNNFPPQNVKSLFTLCVTFMQKQLQFKNVDDYQRHLSKKVEIEPNTLKHITFKIIANLINTDNVNIINNMGKVKTLSNLCFQIVKKCLSGYEERTTKECLTINSINRLTEEAYFNIEEGREGLTENDDYYADEDTNFYEDETEDNDFSNFDEISNTEVNSWISQVEVKEFRSIPNKLTETVRSTEEQRTSPITEDATVITARIKIEPEEEPENIDPSIIKTEPLHNLDEMTIIPESIMTNSISTGNDFTNDQVQGKNSASYDVDSFETFVKSNKLMNALSEHDDFPEIFSQSASRIRRQFEPDWDTENDMAMSLLVPQTFEPMHIENAKDRLMESSGDENNSTKKPAGKKKLDKRKGKLKKVDQKPDKQLSTEKVVAKENPKEKQPAPNEIAVLTRRMREKIRQEEKKIASSDSETENGITSKKFKEINNILSKKTKETLKEASKTKQKNSKTKDDEIQCNNVDSTQQINDQKKCYSPDPNSVQFTGFSAVDQNEGFNYQKYMKYVYDKILPTVSGESKSETNKPIINPDEPVELLECEPTMPIFDNEDTMITSNIVPHEEILVEKTAAAIKRDDRSLPYKLRHGWKCYQLQSNDTKLYEDAQIVLEKLPESFVETYFTYQNISYRDKEDDEVDRLINLQTLNRSKDIRDKGKPKSRLLLQDQISEDNHNDSKAISPVNFDEVVPSDDEGNHAKKKNENISAKREGKSKTKLLSQELTCSRTVSEGNFNDSRAASPTYSDYHELTPSEDENANVEDKVCSPPKKNNNSENTLAKSSLMDDDKDSDNDTKVKIEPDEDVMQRKIKKKPKIGPKSKVKKTEPIDSESFMLTADKMMNRELNLLHAPILPVEEAQKTPLKCPVTRSKQRSANKSATDHKRVKEEDGGSSSEEEKKQWFTIKEKLLKKMINKKDTTREDDAKRAKLVSEFIEKRGDLAEHFLKRRKGRRGRSTKKMLERQKQLRVLSRELFGDVSNDSTHQGKGRNTAYFKGRRNIRKVLDKKCLAKSTVLANMEEFERKRRLNMRQSKLRELLGCEEGVNVLVINDEVCLEYDFEMQRPIVTIHPFFTKVMKAHQYEGVKFMWDACFESLEDIKSGHPGGGCILAHCMGLGKTLQVLALLHTVLTHPRVGMQRVLVCCPLSTVLNWVDEIHKWIGPVTDQIKVFELSKLKKTYERAYQLEDWYKGGGIFIIGYELFRSLTTLDAYLDDVRPVIVNKIRTALLDPGPDIIICDEGHLLKNDCSVLAVAMSRVRTSRRIILTGTPMQNNLREYYCMVNFVKPNLLGTYSEYSNRFENPIMNGQHRDSSEEDIRLMKARTHILHKVLEGCLQRQEASVLYPYLPKKHEYTVFVSLSKCQWDLYKHYLQNCTSTQSNKNNVLKDFHILQKIWSHPQVLHNFQSRTRDDIKSKVKLEKLEDELARDDLNAEDIKPADTDTWWLQYLEGGEMLDSLHSSNKFVCIFRILEECIALGDKLLIFSTSLFTMDALEYFLKKIKDWSLGKEYYRLDGSVPAEVRQKWCREFNSDQNVHTKLFLISTRAGCLGLNMTAANRVIILDTSWNPAHDIQSIFRVYRFGQKKDCYIYRLVALGTMEQKIYERSVTKQAVACRVVDEQQIDRHYNMADLTELYRYDEAGVGVAGGVAVGVEDVVLLRVARDTNLHAVHEHDSLLRGSGEQGLPEHERNAAWMQFQEEHANKQMQEINGHAYTKTAAVKLSPIQSEKGNDPASSESKPERKRGQKKNSVISCYIPIEPQTSINPSAPVDEKREEELVTTITHILIKHNFHIRQEPHEIANLVSKVRKLVAGGNIQESLQEISPSDELSTSIANVLLKNDLPMRQLTNIVCESVNNTINEPSTSTSKEKPEPKRRGRKRGKKKITQEIMKPVETIKEDLVKANGRRKRRAALKAEESFNAITDSIVPASDESDFVPDDLKDAPTCVEDAADYVEEEPDYLEDDSDLAEEGPIIGDSGDEVQNAIVKEEPIDDKVNTGIRSKRSAATSKSGSTRNSDVIESQTKKLHEEMISILLSDDEEIPPPKKKPGPARKTMNPIPKEVENNEQRVPLHPSLLSNQNFIKIVAHTYLTGNPMLDEDAATLAAQYSTQKALKEHESTGKAINSGPLYDIAVKVLGVDILKKLDLTKGKSPFKAIPQLEPEKALDKPQESPVENTTERLVEKPINKPEEKPVETNKTIELVGKGPKLTPIRLKIRVPVEAKKHQPVVTLSPLSTLLNTSVPSPVTSYPVSSYPVTSYPVTPMLTPMPQITTTSTPNVVPVGFYQYNATQPPTSAAWMHPNINSRPTGEQCYPSWPAFHLFKGSADIPAGGTHHSADECILPDDDDIQIISDPVPNITHDIRQSPVVPMTAITEPNSKIPRYLQRVVLKNLRAPPGQDSIINLQNKNSSMSRTSTANKMLYISNTEPNTTTTVHTNPQPSVASKSLVFNTISLDSDDEDILPSVQTSNISSSGPQTAVPVSLTAANPSPSMEVQRAIELHNSLLGRSRSSTNKRSIPQTVEQSKPANIKPLKLTKCRDIPPGVVPIPLTRTSKSPMVGQPSLVSTKETAPSPTVNNDSQSILNSEHEARQNKLCKAGDVLRFSKSGRIEMVNKADKVRPEESKSSGTKHVVVSKLNKKPSLIPTVSIDLDEIPTVQQDVTASKRKTHFDAVRKTTTNQTQSISEIRPRSNSPFNPLSILRDVVHIEADDYAVQQSSNTAKSTTNETSAKPNVVSKPKNVITITHGVIESPLNKQDRDSKDGAWYKVLSHNEKKTQPTVNNSKAPSIKLPLTTRSGNDHVPKSSIQTKDSSTAQPKRIVVTAQASRDKGKNPVIDITGIGDRQTSSVGSKVQTRILKGSTLVGTSKDIILCGTGKAIKRAQPPIIDSIGIVDQPSTSTQFTLAKKKKTEKPMTLKDFDIDDIDDIIELD